MLDGLNRTVLAEVRDALSLQDSDLYFVQHESDEFLNIARRRAEVDFENLQVKVPDRPLVFVRLESVDYGRNTSGYRRFLSPLVYVNDLGKYVGVKLLSVEATYRVVVYAAFGKVAMDLVGVLLSQLNRSSKLLAVSADESFEMELPVSLLLERVEIPSVEFVLRDKGMKMYRLGGELQALTYMLQMGVSRMGTGEYGTEGEKFVEYMPVKKINVRFKVGTSVWAEDGTEIDEVLPCVLEV